jgi:hypothetical protein
MHSTRLLQRWLERNTAFMHRCRAASLTAVVGGLLRGGRLTLSHLGRALCGASHTKHKIKRVDRLLGNSHLHREHTAIYRALAQWLLRGVEQPVIVVDWSDCAPGHKWLMLSAALAVRGRAIPLYEEVHRLSSYNSPRTHRRFLKALKGVLPTDCQPILITDAGFRGPWFRAVEKLGWDWVGRCAIVSRCGWKAPRRGVTPRASIQRQLAGFATWAAARSRTSIPTVPRSTW